MSLFGHEYVEKAGPMGFARHHYLPPGSLRREHLWSSATRTV
jgi:hypothetical protein